MQDAGCKFSASPAQHLPRGCSTGREPPTSHHCLRFVDGFLHTIIITLSICAPSFKKQWENWNSIYSLYKHVSIDNVWKCMVCKTPSSEDLCREACRFQEETICLLRQFETCIKFIVVLKYYWAIPSLNVIHQTWFTCLVCSCSAPTVFAGRLLHNLIQTARGRGMERTTDGQKLSQGSVWEGTSWKLEPNLYNLQSLPFIQTCRIKIIPCRAITMEPDSFINWLIN